MAVPRFMSRATLTVSTKRPPAVSGGKRGAPVTHLTGVSVMPLMPMSSQMAQRMGLEGAAMEKLETYTAEHEHTDSGSPVTQVPDIREGDLLVSGSTEYPVVFVANWPAVGPGGAFIGVVVEEIKS